MNRPTPVPMRPGMGAQTARMAEILRVDHAGEMAAVAIYRGQRAVMSAHRDPSIASTLQEMEAHEAAHLARFDELLTEHGVRPTLMAPAWRLAGFALGAATALMGEKAAHACTEAVETVIEDHYARQIAEIQADPSGPAAALAPELAAFRDDELAHRDAAIEKGALEAPGYPVLAAVIRAGCRTAIRISEKI
jgi:ubiquinone biosynthesis monooxygenase Coq7